MSQRCRDNYFTKHLPFDNCGLDGEEFNGNGALMRILPFALFAYYNKKTNWETNKNVVLALGEPAVEIVYDMATGLQVLDENNKPVLKFKIGDGVTTWENLNYQTGDFQTVLSFRRRH